MHFVHFDRQSVENTLLIAFKVEEGRFVFLKPFPEISFGRVARATSKKEKHRHDCNKKQANEVHGKHLRVWLIRAPWLGVELPCAAFQRKLTKLSV